MQAGDDLRKALWRIDQLIKIFLDLNMYKEYDSIDNDLGEFGIGVGLDVLFQGEGAEGPDTLREAAEHEHDHGTYRQKSDNHNEAGRQCCSGIEHRPVHFESTKQ